MQEIEPCYSHSRTPAMEEKEDKKVDDDGQGGTQLVSAPFNDIPLRYRIIAGALVMFFATGETFAQEVISPLKTLLVEDLKITNAQYGVIASATDLVNTILPIVGGVLMDRWGGTQIALVASALVVIGSILAASSSIHNQYGLLVGGEILLGFGSTVCEVCQYKLYPHWFAGSNMAFIFGLSIGWLRIVQVVAKVSAVPMTHLDDNWGWSLWISAIVCIVSALIVVVYAIFEIRIPKQYRPGFHRHDVHVPETGKHSLSSILDLPKFFWILNGTQALQHGVFTVYTANVSDIQVKTRGTSTETAGYNSSLQAVIPIVLTPVLGYFIDRVGHRMAFVSVTAALYIVVFALLGFTRVNALAPILISSFAYVSNLLPFFAAIPILVDRRDLVGTAFGVFQSFANSGALIMDVAAGAIQDRTPHESYDNVMYFLIALKAVDVLLGPLYDYLDGRWLGHSLRLPEVKRIARYVQEIESGRVFPGLKVSRKTTVIVGSQLAAMIVSGLVVSI